MSHATEVRLTPAERLSRGLRYSAVGPIDVTRGAVGISTNSARSVAADLCRISSELRSRYRDAKLSRQATDAQQVVAREAAAIRQAVADLPQALPPGRRRRRLLIFGSLGLLTVLGGAVAFFKVRRSRQPEPSALPPSVDVVPKP